MRQGWAGRRGPGEIAAREGEAAGLAVWEATGAGRAAARLRGPQSSLCQTRSIRLLRLGTPLGGHLAFALRSRQGARFAVRGPSSAPGGTGGGGGRRLGFFFGGGGSTTGLGGGAVWVGGGGCAGDGGCGGNGREAGRSGGWRNGGEGAEPAGTGTRGRPADVCVLIFWRRKATTRSRICGRRNEWCSLNDAYFYSSRAALTRHPTDSSNALVVRKS